MVAQPAVRPSRDQLVDHIPRHIRQAEVAALELEGELQVVEAEEMQDGGVEVVDMGAVRQRDVDDAAGLAVERLEPAVGESAAAAAARII